MCKVYQTSGEAPYGYFPSALMCGPIRHTIVGQSIRHYFTNEPESLRTKPNLGLMAWPAEVLLEVGRVYALYMLTLLTLFDVFICFSSRTHFIKFIGFFLLYLFLFLLLCYLRFIVFQNNAWKKVYKDDVLTWTIP